MYKRRMQSVLQDLAKQYPVMTITGPRQSGKTTLCQTAFPQKAYVNLEAPDVRLFAREDPRRFLAQYPEGAILDEIQRAPDLLSYIQVLVDEKKLPGLYIVTGSEQLEVSNRISQSLAGRTGILKLLPLSIAELEALPSPPNTDRLMLKGFYPRIHALDLPPTRVLGDYVETYIERDVRSLAAVKDLSLFEKFLRLCAGRIGQVLNLNGLAADTGISHTTARAWMTILEASYVVFLLPPWFRNISKRLIKAPKLYFYDVGLAAFLLGLENEAQVSRDPLRGNLFENLAVMEALKHRYNGGLRSNLSFYRDSNGVEVDLIVDFGGDVFPIEIKAGSTIASDYDKGLRAFKKAVPELRFGAGLLYDGATFQDRTGVRVRPAVTTDGLLEEVEAGR